MVAGYGLAAVIWNPVQLAIANPNDVEATEGEEGGDKYFEDQDVLGEKVYHFKTGTNSKITTQTGSPG